MMAMIKEALNNQNALILERVLCEATQEQVESALGVRRGAPAPSRGVRGTASPARRTKDEARMKAKTLNLVDRVLASIKDFLFLLAHEYFGIDSEIVWAA